MSQKPAWYSGAEAKRVADNLLLYQRASGGWLKNTDMAVVLSEGEKTRLREQKKQNDATIDNSATHTQLRYLARVVAAAGDKRYVEAFNRGLDYLFEAQYANGGWPQFYPNPSGYKKHITFNDDAMIGVMRLLRDIAHEKAPYGFVNAARRKKAARAVEKGIDCILKCQIVHEGKLLAWCAQHDENTFAPAAARSYELISLSGSEGVGVVEFLMEIDNPSPEIVRAVQAAVAWFDGAKVRGIRVTSKPAPGTEDGRDRVVVQDPDAPPIWGRFHQIETNRPFFCSRDGVIRYNLSEISHERRNGYGWYTDRPARMLTETYPRWQKKWAAGQNVLRHE